MGITLSYGKTRPPQQFSPHGGLGKAWSENYLSTSTDSSPDLQLFDLADSGPRPYGGKHGIGKGKAWPANSANYSPTLTDSSPDLADSGPQPYGGKYGIGKGKAWPANSANYSPTLTDSSPDLADSGPRPYGGKHGIGKGKAWSANSANFSRTLSDSQLHDDTRNLIANDVPRSPAASPILLGIQLSPRYLPGELPHHRIATPLVLSQATPPPPPPFDVSEEQEGRKNKRKYINGWEMLVPGYVSPKVGRTERFPKVTETVIDNVTTKEGNQWTPISPDKTHPK